ncbi:MAG: peptidoglycan-binding domain-containing protein [Nocardioidaceae bacterium]
MRLVDLATDWTPWSTYNSGVYQQFLSDAQTAVDNVYGGGDGGSWPLVQQGQTGEQVTSVQYLLNAHGYSVSVDGDFGPATDSAVRDFQTQQGLSADGVVGCQTWQALIISVQSGSTGSAVRAVQSQLNAHGYSVSVDGDFGPATDGAVRDFQSSHGLTSDGIVGTNTWQTLVS